MGIKAKVHAKHSKISFIKQDLHNLRFEKKEQRKKKEKKILY